MEKNDAILILKGKHLSEKSNIFSKIESYLSIIELDLSDNDFTLLPPDLSNFKSLQILDVSNNPFKNYQLVASSLQSLPKLIELKIDLETQSNAYTIISALPQLLKLNGKSTQEDNQNEIDLEDDADIPSLNEEIQRFNFILQQISSFKGFASFKAEFQTKLKEQIDYINSNINIPNYLYAINILKAKVDIYNHLQLKLTTMLPLSTQKNDIETISKIILSIINHTKEHQNQMVKMIFKLSPKIESKINYYKKNDDSLKQKLSHVSSSLEKKIMENKELLYQIHTLKNQTIAVKPNSYLQGNKSSGLLRSSSNSNLFKPPTNVEKRANDNNQNQTNNETCMKLNKSSSQTVMTSNIIPSHQMTLKQLLGMIDDIYQSKVTHDEKCRDNRLPRETLEQHMYTFLNKKYGLKSITIEMACSIINGIKIYSQTNSEVCLFGKILRNELEEESSHVFLKLKQTLIELLSYYYQIKYPYKTQDVIEKLIKEKQQSFLEEDEWYNMLKYLFPSDYDIVKDKVVEYINKQNEFNQKYIEENYPKIQSKRKNVSREEIKTFNAQKVQSKMLYADFTKILLDFQIRLRDKYLSNFVQVFREIDKDKDGILNENEFIELIAKLDIYNGEEQLEKGSEYLLNTADPFNTNKIPFSDCVSALVNTMIDEEEKISIMDKVGLKYCEDIITNQNV